MKTLPFVGVFLGLALIAKTSAPSNLVAKSVTQFSDHFLKVLSGNEQGNFIFSPLSIHTVLSMLCFGVGSNTLKELSSVLNLKCNAPETQSGYSSLTRALNNLRNVTVNIAESIFFPENEPVKSSYVNSMKRIFASDVTKLDFSNSDEAAERINNWVKGKTGNRIKDIVHPDDIDDRTFMVLASAIYFRALWEQKFDPKSTRNMTFHVDRRNSEIVPTMFISAEFNTGEVEGMNARFVELPYEGREFSMVIILPNEIAGLADVEKNLDMIDMTEMLDSGSSEELDLLLPKFQIESSFELIPFLKEMGLHDVFDDRADFSAMSEKPLKLSKVVHKTFFEVNEGGTEAAASTVGGLDWRMLPEEFFVDRPFLFAVRHHATETNLFIGSVRSLS